MKIRIVRPSTLKRNRSGSDAKRRGRARKGGTDVCVSKAFLLSLLSLTHSFHDVWVRAIRFRLTVQSSFGSLFSPKEEKKTIKSAVGILITNSIKGEIDTQSSDAENQFAKSLSLRRMERRAKRRKLSRSRSGRKQFQDYLLLINLLKFIH